MKKKYFIFIGLFALIAIVLGYCWSVKPTVSVVMLTYKRAGIVSKAIDSVLNQTYKDFEFIILNDGSPDNTDEIINKYKDKEFWDRYPFFYIYTPDGKELRYDIYSAGIVKDTSGSYMYQFADESSFAEFVELTKSVSNYDTGVEVGLDAQVITLSTCTKANNDDRFVIHAVKAAEREVENE